MTPSLEGWPTKAKKTPSYVGKTDPARHQPSASMSWGIPGAPENHMEMSTSKQKYWKILDIATKAFVGKIP